MAWSTEYEELMPSTAVIKTLTSVSTDGYGTPVYSAGTSHKARIVHKNTLVRTFAGTEELARTVVWIASTSTYAVEDTQITVGGSTLGPLMSLEAYTDEDGVHHNKAFFG